ncbi:hypothetical protein E2C01_031174 [Portunus trituberculatus]|uniref:DDE Tnp4 domain-containing protein n=1 Tax=Portunus trituberculatus TaxID=210409 RepID=A0A5B7EW63_PORTR|nr:hypothetical protein [Portunus trituberculatus]
MVEGFERGTVTAGCHLLGDSGYPSKKWLLTLHLRPLSGPHSNYNRGVESELELRSRLLLARVGVGVGVGVGIGISVGVGVRKNMSDSDSFT